MLKWEIRVLLAHYLEQGLSKAAISRQLGIDRRTINRWIAGQLDREVETGQVPRPSRKRLPTKLDPFQPIVRRGSRSTLSSPPFASSKRSEPPATVAGSVS